MDIVGLSKIIFFVSIIGSYLASFCLLGTNHSRLIFSARICSIVFSILALASSFGFGELSVPLLKLSFTFSWQILGIRILLFLFLAEQIGLLFSNSLSGSFALLLGTLQIGMIALFGAKAFWVQSIYYALIYVCLMLLSWNTSLKRDIFLMKRIFLIESILFLLFILLNLFEFAFVSHLFGQNMCILLFFIFIFFRIGAYPFFLKGRDSAECDSGYLFWLRSSVVIAGVAMPVILHRFQLLLNHDYFILHVCEAFILMYLTYLALKIFFLKKRKEIFLSMYAFVSSLLTLLLCLTALTQIQVIQYLIYLVLLSWGLSQFIHETGGMFKSGISFARPIFSIFMLFYLFSLYGMPLGLGFQIKTFSLKLIIENRPVIYWSWVVFLHFLVLFSFYHFSFKSLVNKEQIVEATNNKKEIIWFATISSLLIILGLYPRFFEMMATWGWR